jgi:predicted Zn finger-like uncharacterized protein
MVIYCKRCGAASRIDETRMPATTLQIKCQQCQNLITVEPPKAGSPGVHPATPVPAGSAGPRPPVAPPPVPRAAAPPAAPLPAVALRGGVATAVAAQPEPSPAAVPGPTHFLQKI